MPERRSNSGEKPDLYTPEERARRDATAWTLVQGVLAPLQFLAFGISLALIVRFLVTGQGEGAAAVSVMVKTGFLYAIMVTGAFWEKAVFGRYLFAPAFFWEDAVSMIVIALHTLYMLLCLGHLASVQVQFLVALAAYASYTVNAAQFVWKFSLAKRGRTARQMGPEALA